MIPLLSIVLPFYNEEECVEEAVREIHSSLQAAGISFEVIAVQNGSRDKTPQILKRLEEQLPGLLVVEVPLNKGFGYGVVQGLNAAKGQIVGFMPGDRQIEVGEVLRILDRIQVTGSDLGKIRRVTRGDGWQRRLASKFFNLLVKTAFNLKIDDINGEPTLLRRDLYAAMEVRSADNFIDVEIVLKAKKLGAKMCQVDAAFLKRRTGCSKVKPGIVLEFLGNILKARFSRHDRWGINALGLSKNYAPK